MSHKPLISAVINIHNESSTLVKCLRSLKGFASEIIVIDMESTDNGAEIAKNFGAVVFPHKLQKVVEQARNFALKKATGSWIILLDPDEYLSLTLKKELFKITTRSDINFVKIPRKNYIFGKWIRHANCWPDYLIRFFKKGSVTWQPIIHSQPIIQGTGLTLLDTPLLAIRHQNYLNLTHFIHQTLRYSGVQADELLQSNYKLKTSDFILKPVQEFNSRYFAGSGFKDGLHGLIFCLLQSIAIFLIYVQLWEKQGSIDKQITKDSFVSASQVAVFEYSHWFTRYFLREYSPNIIKKIIIKFRHLLNRLTRNF